MKKLGFGLMRLPRTDPEDPAAIDLPQVEQMVDTFLERGFTYFDTAYMYHGGMSEAAAREALVKRHPRDRFTLATKLPVMKLEAEGDQERIFEEQRTKCGVEYFDYYLLHSLTEKHLETANRFDSFGFVSRLKAEGKVKHIGFSFHDTAALLDRILTDHPEMEFVQLQINYLDWDSESVQSRLCYETAVRHGKQVIIMEPLKGGALAMLPDDAAKLLRDADPNATLASWALRFAAGLPNVITILSGMGSLAQLTENTALMDAPKPLSETERALLYQVAEIINGFTAVPCTACRYCVDGCPQKISIPDVFGFYNDKKRAELLRRKGLKFIRDYTAFTEQGGKASSCIGCRQCEGVCPQHLSIVSLLQDVATAMEEN